MTSTSPVIAVARRSIWANRSSRPTVRPRMVSLWPVSSSNNRPKPARIASEISPAPGWPPSQLTARTTMPSPTQSSGRNHVERATAWQRSLIVISWLRSLIIEHLLDRDAEVPGERDRQRQRGGVPVVLDRVDRLPRHPHRLRQFPLGQA